MAPRKQQKLLDRRPAKRRPLLSVLPGRLRRARKAKGMTVSSLAALAGCSTDLIQRIEGEHRLPTIKLLCNLSDALSTTSDYLLGRCRASGPVIVRVYQKPVKESATAVRAVVGTSRGQESVGTDQLKVWNPMGEK